MPGWGGAALLSRHGDLPEEKATRGRVRTGAGVSRNQLLNPLGHSVPLIVTL